MSNCWSLPPASRYPWSVGALVPRDGFLPIKKCELVHCDTADVKKSAGRLNKEEIRQQRGLKRWKRVLAEFILNKRDDAWRVALPANAQAGRRSSRRVYRPLPQFLTTSFSCHSCCSQISSVGWSHIDVSLGARAALDLAHDVKHHDYPNVHQAEDHDCVRRQFESLSLFCKEWKRVSLGSALTTLHIW